MKLPNQSIGVRCSASNQADSLGIVSTNGISTASEQAGLTFYCAPVPYGIPSVGIYGYTYLCLGFIGGEQIQV
jgi:hypothetical protein